MYEQTRTELRQGEKQSHWKRFISPQHRNLGRSADGKELWFVR
jgi:uncharacterized protein (DUF1810 family)